MFTVATLYCLAVILTIVFAAPVALLAPIFFAVSLDLPADVAPMTDTAVVTADTVPSVSCAPFVAVYLSRGESRPTVHPWTVCPSTPAVHPLSRNGRPLRGAAMRASIAKANRKGCTSHACPTVRS